MFTVISFFILAVCLVTTNYINKSSIKKYDGAKGFLIINFLLLITIIVISYISGGFEKAGVAVENFVTSFTLPILVGMYFHNKFVKTK
jgi:hypothetical protein